MSVYLILFIFFSSLSLVSLDFMPKVGCKLKFLIFDLFILLLIVVSASKTPLTSWDTNNYYTYFVAAPLLQNYSFVWWGFEPGYALLNTVIKTLGFSHNVLFFIMSAFSLCLYRITILKYSRYIFLSLFVYVSCFYFLNEMIVIRYGLASAILFYNIGNVIDGKRLKSLLCLCLALAFHYTSIVGLVPILLWKDKNQDYYFILTLVAFVFVCFFLVFPPLKLIIDLSEFLPQSIGDIVSRVTRYEELENSSGYKRAIMYLPVIILIFPAFLNAFKNRKKTKLVSIIFLHLLLAFFFMITFSEIASFARLNQIFLGGNILGFGLTVQEYKKDYRFLPLCLLYVIVLCSYIFVRHVFFNSGGSINLIW